MKYPGPLKPEPPSDGHRWWWGGLLTIACAGGYLIIYWLLKAGLIDQDVMLVAIIIGVPVFTFLLVR
ncbi:MAG: hypothetical protein AB7G25_04850 [Sphingomonadaceae bacterium]